MEQFSFFFYKKRLIYNPHNYCKKGELFQLFVFCSYSTVTYSKLSKLAVALPLICVRDALLDFRSEIFYNILILL